MRLFFAKTMFQRVTALHVTVVCTICTKNNAANSAKYEKACFTTKTHKPLSQMKPL